MADKIIFATGNKNKMREIRDILSDLGMEILSMKEAGIDKEINEDGKTFEENALIKARAVAEYTDAVVLADDSGLEIDYLNKEPGIYSARYLGEDTSYEIKNQALLDRLSGVKKKTAPRVSSVRSQQCCRINGSLLCGRRSRVILERSRREPMALVMIRSFM